MDNTDKFNRLCDLFNQMVNQYGRYEKELHTYGTDFSLHLSDTHTIAAIGKHNNINITSLAKLQGISKSAVSQMISKLVRRGLVRKEFSPTSENEVVLSLTENGEIIFHTHEKQHAWLQERFASVLEKYPEDTLDLFMELSLELQDIWKNVPFEE